MTRLSQLLSIKHGEGRTASLVIGVMLFTAFGAALGGTGIEALFFARFGVDYLPYMYIGLGLTSMLTSFMITAALGRIPKKILYVTIPLLVALILVGARLALLTRLNWLYPTLWLGKEVLNSLVNLVIWGVAGVVCDTRQAKRLFPLFNASRILGQVIGGFATGVFVSVIGTENLIMVWVGSLLFAFAFSRALLARQRVASTPEGKSRRKQPKLIQEMQRGYQYVRNSKLMTWIAISTIFFSILYFSIALPFSRAATEHYINEDALASFLGLFNGVSTAAAFLVSLLLANRLFARFGIMLCILVFPIIYLIGFGSLALQQLFMIIVAFRFIQMLWLSGIADPAWQTMFNVVPPERRDQVRAFIGGVPEQAGTFIAGGILVIGEQTLTPQQLYFIGLFAAVACTYVIYQARRGYNDALIEALRAGRPQLFYSEEQPFGGFHQDASAVTATLNGLNDTNPVIRRVSAEILGHLSLPESTNALVHGLSDMDSLVRAACLRALAQSKATSALLDIAASLRDPEPDVRFEAVSAIATLAGYPSGLTNYLAPMLDDNDTRVSVRAAVSILRRLSTNGSRVGDEGDVITKAQYHLRNTAAFGEVTERLNAITAMGEWSDPKAFHFLHGELRDLSEPAALRSAAAESLAQIDSMKAMPYFINALSDSELYVRETSARLLGNIGPPAMESVITALFEADKADGALLALQKLPLPPAKPIVEFARAAVSRAVEYDGLRRGVQGSDGNTRAERNQSEAISLLVESLHHKSHEHGIRALRAIGLLGDRDAMNIAIENLQTPDTSQRANVIEALESISSKWRDTLQPLMQLWEDDHARVDQPNWERLFVDEDEWIWECAAYVANKIGEKTMDTISTLSLMDRILFFKRVPLFANLAPADLKQVAAISEEHIFANGAVLAEQGEPGDEIYIIISGEVRVCVTKNGREVEVARRTSGDYVGELAIINREPRNATLVASGDVRALCIDQKSFEGLMRERPEVSLVVIRVLSKRLKELMDQRQ